MLDKITRNLKTIYSSSLVTQKLAKKISGSGPYFWITKGKIAKQKEKDKNGPFNLVIETSNFCNARCIMCPYRIMKRTKKIMDDKTFDKIVSRIKEERVSMNKIFFSGMGEPLTDPHLASRIRVLKELGFFVKVYTNASLLIQGVAQQFVDLGLDEINISFNGILPEQYQKIMGLDFETTKRNIERLISIKKEIGSRLPIIRISSIVVKENEKDIKKHIDYWRDKVDSVTVSMAHEWGGTIELATDRRFQKARRIYPCRSLWHTFNIDSQGNFVICCRDYESQYILGNIHTHAFNQIKKSPILERFHNLHLEFSQDKLPEMCQHCNFPYQDGIEWYLGRQID